MTAADINTGISAILECFEMMYVFPLAIPKVLRIEIHMCVLQAFCVLASPRIQLQALRAQTTTVLRRIL